METNDTLQHHLQARKLTQAKAAELFGVTQPRISDLVRGRLDLFSIDALVDVADKIDWPTDTLGHAPPNELPMRDPDGALRAPGHRCRWSQKRMHGSQSPRFAEAGC